MKHTPAPWWVQHHNEQLFIAARDEGVDAAICEIRYYPQAEADARLIAAGPELLEALKSVAAAYGWESEDAVRSPISKAVIRAIAKAEGEQP